MLSLANEFTVPARSADPSPDLDEWARVWFDLTERPWWSLALVPASSGVPVLAAAQRLLECATALQSGPTRLLDARAAQPGDVAAFNATTAAHVASMERVIAVLESPLTNAAAIPLARAANAALLLVPLGTTGVRDARRVVAAVGASRFIGSVTIRPK